MSSSGGGGAGALRVKAKLKAALKNGNFYEAHQMYRYAKGCPLGSKVVNTVAPCKLGTLVAIKW